MTTLSDIEKLTADYADARSYLAGVITELQTELERVRHPVLPVIRKAVKACADRHSSLCAAIEGTPDLFKRPRTRTLSGVRVGFMKQRGQVQIDDEEAVCSRICKLLPEDQAELLIRVTRRVHKPAVYDLEARDLKRLGITVTADSDAVVIKPVDGEVDKLVDALLADAERTEAEA